MVVWFDLLTAREFSIHADSFQAHRLEHGEDVLGWAADEAAVKVAPREALIGERLREIGSWPTGFLAVEDDSIAVAFGAELPDVVRMGGEDDVPSVAEDDVTALVEVSGAEVVPVQKGFCHQAAPCLIHAEDDGDDAKVVQALQELLVVVVRFFWDAAGDGDDGNAHSFLAVMVSWPRVQRSAFTAANPASVRRWNRFS